MSESSQINPYHISRRKRVLDVAVALPLFVCLAPIESMARHMLKKELDEGPVYFEQERTVAGLSPFMLRKLRTMRNGNSVDASSEYTDRNPRIAGLRAAKVRALKADEIPQLRQVLNGQLSIVSIRPIPTQLADHLKEVVPDTLYDEWHTKAEANHIRGGLTGPTQVQDLDVDPLELTKDYPARMQSEIDYMDNANLREDVRIITITAIGLLRRAHEAQHAPVLEPAR